MKRQFHTTKIFISILLCICLGQWACKPYDSQQLQKIDLSQNNSFHDIEALDDNLAFAYSYGTGQIIQTTNGGEKWDTIAQLDSVYLEQIQFFNPMLGVLCGNNNTLLQTKDGGKNWTSIGIKDLEEDAAIYGMLFTSERTGYVSVLKRNKEGFLSSIYKTKDAGQSWQLINEIPEMILHLTEIDGLIWGTGNHVIIKNISQSNWSYEFKDEDKRVGQIRSLVQTPKAIIGLSFNGYVLRKTQSWSVQKITNNRLRSIANDQNYLLAVGDNNEELGNLFESNDSGKNWSIVHTKFEDIHRITATRNKFWAIGKNDQLLILEKN